MSERFDTLEDVAARAEAVLAAHDAHRASILREDLAGIHLCHASTSSHHKRSERTQKGHTGVQKAVPLSKDWRLAEDELDHDARELPANIAPGRCDHTASLLSVRDQDVCMEPLVMLVIGETKRAGVT
jgi:hypothetical protein